MAMVPLETKRGNTRRLAQQTLQTIPNAMSSHPPKPKPFAKKLLFYLAVKGELETLQTSDSQTSSVTSVSTQFQIFPEMVLSYKFIG